MKRKSEIDRRLKRIRKELLSVDSNLHTLEKNAEREKGARRSAVLSTPAPPPSVDTTSRRESRFADYLSSSLQAPPPLRRERRIQRNKAILMSVFVLLVLFWILHRVFL